MKKKTLLIILLIVALSVAIVCFFACDRASLEETDSLSTAELEKLGLDDSDFDNPAYDKEQDGAEINKVVKSQEDFYGTWEAHSDYAEYLYGNLNLTVNEDGTWLGNVTGDDYNGSWTYKDGTMNLSSEIFSCVLFYDESGALLFQDCDDMDFYLALTRGPK